VLWENVYCSEEDVKDAIKDEEHPTHFEVVFFENPYYNE